jgi:hypothetical protein
MESTMKASFTYSLTQQGLEAGSTVFAAGIVRTIKDIVRTHDTPSPSAIAFGLSMEIIQRPLRYACDFTHRHDGSECIISS